MTRRDQAIALLTREVLCEAIFRRRADWDAEHPNRSLHLRRGIDLDVVVAHVDDQDVMALEPESLRAFASIVLDLAQRHGR